MQAFQCIWLDISLACGQGNVKPSPCAISRASPQIARTCVDGHWAPHPFASDVSMHGHAGEFESGTSRAEAPAKTHNNTTVMRTRPFRGNRDHPFTVLSCVIRVALAEKAAVFAKGHTAQVGPRPVICQDPILIAVCWDPSGVAPQNHGS